MPKTEAVCREVSKLYDALWRFVRVEGVEPTNNAAERAIRPSVLWRKGSFGTRSARGSRLEPHRRSRLLLGHNTLRIVFDSTSPSLRM